MLDELEYDESFGEWSLDEETLKLMRPEEIAKLSPLHQHYVAPLSFLVDAVHSGNSFNITSTCAPFGNNLEAYVASATKAFLK